MLLSHAKRNARRWLALSAAAMVGIGSSWVHADLLFWDPSQTTTTSGGGDGTWDQTLPNWYDPSLQIDVPWSNSGQFAGSPDDAFFGGTAGTVSLTDNIVANTLNFNSTGYLLSGSSLTLASGTPTTFSVTTASGNTTVVTSVAGNPNVTVGSGLSATINSPFLGASSNSASSDVLTFDGGGTLTLGGQSTYGGATSILSGTIQLAVDNALPAATTVFLGTNQGSSSATLNLGNFNQTINSLQAISGANVAGGATDTIVINAGKTLSITGAGGPTLYFGSADGTTSGGSGSGYLTNVYFVGPTGLGSGGGGNLTINATYSNGVPTYGANTGAALDIGGRGDRAVVDMRDLSSFTASLGTLEVGDYNQASNGNDASTFYLAPISNITVSTFRVGADSAGSAGSAYYESLYLGNASNTINALDMRIGVMSGTSTTNARVDAQLLFNGGATSSGSITTKNFGGTSVYGSFGPTLYQIETGAATSNNLISLIDFTGHQSYLNFQQLIMAYRGSGTSSTASGTEGATATFTFNPPASDTTSYLNVLNYSPSGPGAPAAGPSVVMGDRFSYGGNILATLNVGGNPAVPVRLGLITMGTNTSANAGKPGTSTGQLNVAGASVQIDSIQMADSTETGNLNDSSNGILNITGGTVQMVNQLAGQFGNGASVITRANGGGTENTTLTLTGGGVLDMNGYAIGSSSAFIGSGTGSSMKFGSTPVAGFGTSSTLLVGTLKNLAQLNGGLTPLLQATAGGTLILTGNNTYTGGTAITAGTILADSPAGFSSTGNGLLTVSSGGLLAGTGYVIGAASQVNVNAGTSAPGGTISAGTGATSASAVGLLTTKGGDGGATAYSEVWNGGSGSTGGAYDWKVNAASSTNSTVTQSNGVGTTDPGGAGTNWDMLSLASLSVVRPAARSLTSRSSRSEQPPRRSIPARRPTGRSPT